MSPVLAWARVDLRLRWRSLLVLTLLVAVSAGVILTTLAGARRTHTALERFEARASTADVMVLPNRPGFDWDRVRRLPSVKALNTFVLIGGDAEPQSSAPSGFPAGDPGPPVDRPILRSGRLADPNDPLEATASEGFVKRYGRSVTVKLPTKAQIGPDGSVAPNVRYAGPTVRVRIVGEQQDLFSVANESGATPTFLPTYGFFRTYIKPLVPWFANARVALRGGAAAIPRFRRELAAVTHRDIDVLDWRQYIASRQQSADFTAAGWLCFSLVALLASLVLVGQAFARFCAGSSDELRTLGALGMDRRQARLAAAAGPTLAGLLGCAAGLAGAVLTSGRFPTGAVRDFDPDPGIQLEPLAMIGGAVLLAAVTSAGAWRAARAGRDAEARPGTRRSAVAAATAATGLGVVAVLGTRFALEPGRGRTRVPVRPALIGAVAGVIGIIGVTTFREGLSDAVTNPERFGQTLPTFVFLAGGGPPAPTDLRAARAAAASPAISVLDDERIAVFAVNDRPVSTYSRHVLKGRVRTVALHGRAPVRADEIAIGPKTAEELHVGAGDRVRVGARRLTVSGVVYVPQGFHNEYDDGAILTAAGFAAQQPDPAKDKFRVLRLAPAAGASQADVAKALGPLAGQSGPSPLPTRVEDLRNVRAQPVLLAGFLLVLALGAVGHALATAVRRRRRDMAVLRALGMTRGQSSRTVATQATVIAIVGLVFGLPLGVAAGRTAWRFLADATPMVYAAPIAVLALVLAVPGAPAVANAIAAVPARRAARLRVAEILRSE